MERKIHERMIEREKSRPKLVKILWNGRACDVFEVTPDMVNNKGKRIVPNESAPRGYVAAHVGEYVIIINPRNCVICAHGFDPEPFHQEYLNQFKKGN